MAVVLVRTFGPKLFWREAVLAQIHFNEQIIFWVHNLYIKRISIVTWRYTNITGSNLIISDSCRFKYYGNINNRRDWKKSNKYVNRFKYQIDRFKDAMIIIVLPMTIYRRVVNIIQPGKLMGNYIGTFGRIRLIN